MGTPQRGTTTVLLVDDNADSLDMMEEAFSTAGFAVLKAHSAVGAVKLLDQGHRPALILTDLVMPYWSGRDLIEHLRKDAKFRRVPVIVLTGMDPEGLHVPADVIMRKPINLDVLIETAQRVLALAER